MIDVRQTDEFARWLRALRDRTAQARIAQRLVRIGAGLLGDVKPVGSGVFEVRVDTGPGYRLYYVRRGEVVMLLLCGGDKASQSRDIDHAVRLARQMEDL